MRQVPKDALAKLGAETWEERSAALQAYARALPGRELDAAAAGEVRSSRRAEPQGPQAALLCASAGFA